MNHFWEAFIKKAFPSKFAVLRSLGLKDDEYCILGGAVELLGIRASNDLDVVVTPQAFDRIAKEKGLRTQKSFLGSRMIQYNGIEMFTDDGFGKTAQDLIKNARKVGSFMVVSLPDLLSWKRKLKNQPGRNPLKLKTDTSDIRALEVMAHA